MSVLCRVRYSKGQSSYDNKYKTRLHTNNRVTGDTGAVRHVRCQFVSKCRETRRLLQGYQTYSLITPVRRNLWRTSEEPLRNLWGTSEEPYLSTASNKRPGSTQVPTGKLTPPFTSYQKPCSDLSRHLLGQERKKRERSQFDWLNSKPTRHPSYHDSQKLISELTSSLLNPESTSQYRLVMGSSRSGYRGLRGKSRDGNIITSSSLTKQENIILCGGRRSRLWYKKKQKQSKERWSCYNLCFTVTPPIWRLL